MKTAIGRIVHFSTQPSSPDNRAKVECRAAIITDVGVAKGNEAIGLCVFAPNGFFFARYVLYDVKAKSGTWHWHDQCPRELFSRDQNRETEDETEAARLSPL